MSSRDPQAAFSHAHADPSKLRAQLPLMRSLVAMAPARPLGVVGLQPALPSVLLLRRGRQKAPGWGATTAGAVTRDEESSENSATFYLAVAGAFDTRLLAPASALAPSHAPDTPPPLSS